MGFHKYNFTGPLQHKSISGPMIALSFANSSAYGVHSNHRYFIDSRHINHATHLWVVFHSAICLGDCLPTSAGFKQLLACRRSEKTFQGVTLSFYFSNYWLFYFHKSLNFSFKNNSNYTRHHSLAYSDNIPLCARYRSHRL